MTTPLEKALDSFVTRYVQQAKEQGKPLQIEYDPDWPSACYQGVASVGEWVAWLPVKCQPKLNLSNLEQGLELTIHADIHTFFTRYWSDNLNATTSKGKLQLLLPWNEDDFVRLQQNLIGHVMMKRRLKHPETLFFAVTDQEDYILTVDNASGAVMLERVGVLATETLAPNLASFIDSLQPLSPDQAF